MEAVPANCLRDVRPLALRACVIGIDEGQFVSLSIYLHFTFTPLFFVFFLSPFLKKILYCYLSDFKIKSFFFIRYFDRHLLCFYLFFHFN